MAQITPPQHLTDAVTDGFARSLAGAREWAADGLDHLRRSILPDHDTPYAPAMSASRPASSGSLRHRLFALAPQLILALAVLVLLGAVGLFGFRTWYADRIYPAVLVGDVPVGGLTVAEAEAALTARAAALETGTITFTYGDQTFAPTLAELGVTVDLAGSLADAQALGRAGDAADRLATARQLLQDDQVVPLRTALDTAVLGRWFDTVDAALGQPAVDAQVVVEGTQVTLRPEAAGLAVDRAAATAQLVAALEDLTPVTVALPTAVAEPAITAAELAEAQSFVQSVLDSPIRVKFENRAWRIDAGTLAGYMTVETVMENGIPTARLAMDTERLAADLRAQFASEINREPVNARVAWSTDEGLIALDPSETGVTLKAGAFAEAVAASFLGDQDRVEIPVVITRPEIDDENLDALGIETQLGRGDSNYQGGSWQRDENINVGVNLLNGTLVRPGAEFSFNDAIGDITPDKGYVEASVVVAERVGTDYGGGICQVSTTVFRAAILAGMPITEWHPHTYRIQNYERDGWGPGFDASILQYGADREQWADLEFTNYTDGWLLVEAWTDWPYVIVNIYGKDTGYTVDIVNQWQSDPISNNEDVEIYTADLPAGQRRQTEWPMDGLEAAFTRVIYDANGEVVHERQFYTYFQGRGNVYEVGTG